MKEIFLIQENMKLVLKWLTNNLIFFSPVVEDKKYQAM